LVIIPSSSTADEKANKEAADGQKAKESTDGHADYVCCLELRGCALPCRIGMRKI
jgi:hypothetical protein